MIQIGSKALKFVAEPRLSDLKVQDTDFIATDMELKKFRPFTKSLYPIKAGKYVGIDSVFDKIYEIEIARDGNSAEDLMNLLDENSNLIFDRRHFDDIPIVIPSLDVLYMLKMSHRYLRNSPHFHKTREHIRIMRNLGAKWIPKLSDWFKKREKETYWYQHPKLNQDKNSFFADDNIEYEFDHDWLHEIVALKDVPRYTLYQVEGEDVLCSKDKFFSLPYEDRIYGVAEEAMVLALERAVIPNGMEVEKAKRIALEKVCTSITSGWFREFAWENYDTCWVVLSNMKLPKELHTRIGV